MSIDNHLIHQLNIVILKNFTYHEIFCEMFFLSQGNFLYCPNFFRLTKNLNTALTPTEIKQNLACCIDFFCLDFFSFCQVNKHLSGQV